MSYRFKGSNIILDGETIKIEPKTLPENPIIGQIILDQVDNKLKLWGGTKWFILGDAGDMFFNNDNSSLSSTNTEDAIKEIETKTMKRRDLISFSSQGNTTNNWLSQNNSSLSTNKTFFTPPYNCRIIRVSFSNKKSGSESNPLHTKLAIHHKHYTEEGNINTSHSTAWYVTSEENTNRINYGENGRTWIYDNYSEEDTMSVTIDTH